MTEKEILKLFDKDKELANFLKLSDFENQKIKNSIIYFLEKTKSANYVVYKTQLLKFLSFLEFYNFKEYAAPYSDLKFVAMGNGPLPSDFFDLFKNQKINKNILKSIPFEFNNKNKNDNRILITFKDGFSFNDSFFSKSDLKALEFASNKIIELADVTKITEYIHNNSKSWAKSWKICKKTSKGSTKMNFVEDAESDLTSLEKRELLKFYEIN